MTRTPTWQWPVTYVLMAMSVQFYQKRLNIFFQNPQHSFTPVAY
jgi:hypothetical protein